MKKLKSRGEGEGGVLCAPKKPVAALAFMLAFTLLTYGSMLEWSSLYVTQEAGVPLHLASYGYCIIALCILALRLASLYLIEKLGPVICCVGGSFMMFAGLALMTIFPSPVVATLSFFIIGCGISNISPLLASAASHQTCMPLMSAVAFMSLCGYTGMLLGPALLGVVAKFTGLSGIFVLLSCMSLVNAVIMYLNRSLIAIIDPVSERRLRHSQRRASLSGALFALYSITLMRLKLPVEIRATEKTRIDSNRVRHDSRTAVTFQGSGYR